MSISMGQLASRYADAARRLPEATRANLGRLALAGVGLVKVAIQEVHAVDTGTMLNSTNAEQVDATTYLIGPTTNYAVFVALGKSRVTARPFHWIAARRLGAQATALGFDTKEVGI